MSKLNYADRHFTVYSDLRSSTRCFVVYDDYIDGITPNQIMNRMAETDNISPLAYFRKPFFMVDTQLFTNCLIFEIAFKGTSRKLDMLTFEAIAFAEMTYLFDMLRTEYGAKGK